MNTNIIIDLARAGYTKEEIAALMAAETPAAETPAAEAPAAETPAAEAPAAEAPAAEAPAIEPNAVEPPAAGGLNIFIDAIKQMIDSNNKLRETIQATNIINDSHGLGSNDDIESKAYNALTAICGTKKGE